MSTFVSAGKAVFCWKFKDLNLLELMGGPKSTTGFPPLEARVRKAN